MNGIKTLESLKGDLQVIIDESAEAEYPHPAFADVDMRAKKEDRAKRMGLTMGGM